MARAIKAEVVSPGLNGNKDGAGGGNQDASQSGGARTRRPDYLRCVDYPGINPSILPTIQFKEENNGMVSAWKWVEQCGCWLTMLNLENLAVLLWHIEID